MHVILHTRLSLFSEKIGEPVDEAMGLASLALLLVYSHNHLLGGGLICDVRL